MNARFGTALLVLVIAQSLFLAAMIRDRVSLLRSDDVVTLQTEPIDPRDLFRGDYVILNYDVSRLTLGTLGGDTAFESGDEIYVELAPGETTWNAIALWKEWREPAAGNSILRGRVSWVLEGAPVTAEPGEGGEIERPCPECRVANVAYGIESYFVPEGEGRVLEDERNAGNLTVDVALGSDGEGAIKRLRLDGEPVYEEPLF
ncbi:MAG: GDYXXLXY domain-containing protein [Parvibaculum sp.]